MRKCWGKRAAVVTALPKNDLGWLVEDFIMQGGVDMSHVIWRDFDGLGRNTRVGLNFTEKGFGIRPALGCSDRGHTAASQIRPGEVNWEKLFGEEGVRWFHTGGIFAALASNTAEAVIEAVQVAKKYGTVVSYDLNYRASLWKSQGGKDAAQRVNREIAKLRRRDDRQRGGLHRLPRLRGRRRRRAPDQHRDRALQADDRDGGAATFPNFKVAATTLRNATTATLQRLVGDPLARRPASTSR